MGEKTIYSALSIKKTYLDEDGRTLINVLRGIDIEIHRRDVVGIVGPSGSGKSTLLHILGFMDRDFVGDLYFDGKSFHTMSEAERNQILRSKIGFLFQHHHLLSELNVIENILLPLRVCGFGVERDSVARIIDVLGLSGKEKRYPHELSGGEKQKVALARAVVKNPEVIFCDEPTGNLDASSSEMVKNLLRDLRNNLGFTLVIVTHNTSLLKGFSDRIYEMQDGRLKEIAISMN